MRWVLLLGLLAGCQQIFGLTAPEAMHDAARDARPDVAHDGPGLPGCTADSNLIACYDFEDTEKDSAPFPNATSASGITFVPGKIGKAVSMSDSSTIKIEDSPLLDTAAVTLEAWIHPTLLPPVGTRMGIWDTDGQYGMFLMPGGDLECAANGILESSPAIVAGTWTHVACTADGDTIAGYVNGTRIFAQAGGAPLITTATNGAEIGGNAPTMTDQFRGEIDAVRVYRIARARDDICIDASCPP